MDIVHFRPCEPDKCTKYVKLFTNHMPYPHPEKRLPGASLKKCKPNAAQPFPPIRQARRSQPVHRPILLPFTGRRRSPAHRRVFLQKQKKNLYPVGYRF